MAKPATNKGETTVTRIKASDSKAAKAAVTSTRSSATKRKIAPEQSKQEKTGRKNPFARMWTYFKGAWTELRLVRWPDRKATWGMTGALIAFTLFFVVIILVLDYGFSQLFKLILGSN